MTNTEAKGPQELLAEMTKERDAAVDHASKLDARIADAIKQCAEEHHDYATELESCDRWIEFCKQQKPEDWYGINFMQGKRSGIVLGNIIHSKLIRSLTAERDEMLRRIGANETAQLLTQAVQKQCEETQRIAADREHIREWAIRCQAETEHQARLAMEARAERNAEREARKELAAALQRLMDCITKRMSEPLKDDKESGDRVVAVFDSMRDAVLALALAAKLPT